MTWEELLHESLRGKEIQSPEETAQSLVREKKRPRNDYQDWEPPKRSEGYNDEELRRALDEMSLER